MPTNANGEVIYTTEKDWDDWHKDFQQKVRQLNVWEYVRKEVPLPWPTKPVRPDYTHYTTNVVLDSQAASSATIGIPDSTTLVLTKEGEKRYEMDLRTFEYD